MKPKADNRETYHHGDLPQVLMDLAVEHIRETGFEKLSLRALARDAGVSATAPYRHFPSRQCLLAGLAMRGFRRLTARMQPTVNSDKPFRERFIDMGNAYIDNAIADPVSYRVMFGGVVDFQQYPNLQLAAEESFTQLLTALADNVDLNPLAMTLDELAGAVWAGVHGMASLLSTDLGTDAKSPSVAARSVTALAGNRDRTLELMYERLLGEPT